MSHCINAIIFKKTDKIKGGTSLPQDFVITGNSPSNFNVLKHLNLAFIKITTDYFGGAGEQSAVYVDEETVLRTCYGGDHPINKALKDLGVKKDLKHDEFDTVNLGEYRSNDDFNGKISSTTNLNKNEIRNKAIDTFYKRLEELQRDIQTLKDALGTKNG